MFTTQNPDPQARKRFLLLRPFVALWRWLFPPTLADRDRQSKSSRIIGATVIIVFCVGLVTLTMLNGRSWYNSYQTWQANRMVAEAEEMEKQDRLADAWNLASKAYALDPENAKVLRTLARYYTARGQKEAFYLLDKIEKLGLPVTDDDRLLRIQALANSNEAKDAQFKIEELLRSAPPSARMVEIADQVMQRRGRTRQLLDILRSYVALKPDDREIGLKLATREVQFGTAEEIADGMRKLWTLAEDPSKTGLAALEFLEAQKLGGEEDQRKLIALLQKHPLAGEEQRIAALRRLVALEPARRAEIIDQAILERRDAAREDLVPLAHWLAQDGEHERLLGFLKLEMVQDYPPLLNEYLNALTKANRYEELDKLVQDPRTRLTVSDRAFYRAHLAYVRKKSWDQVNALIVDALRAAQADARPQDYLRVAVWSELHKHPLVAQQAYRAASVNRASEQIQRLGFEGLLKLTYANGDSKGFMEAIRDAARRWPENQHFLERSLYASLLAGIEMETTIPQVQKLLEAKPDDSQRKLLMALALYRMLDSKAALQYLRQLNAAELSPGQGAVICGILFSAGDSAASEAKRIGQQIPTNAVMLPEERKFLEQVMMGPSTASSSAAPGQP